MNLLWALIQPGVSQHQETAVSHMNVYRESVSDSHNQFSCCIIDPLFTVGGFIHGEYRNISLPTRWWDQVPPWSCHLRVPAGHLKLVFVACSTTRHGGGDVYLGRGCVRRADVYYIYSINGIHDNRWCISTVWAVFICLKWGLLRWHSHEKRWGGSLILVCEKSRFVLANVSIRVLWPSSEDEARGCMSEESTGKVSIGRACMDKPPSNQVGGSLCNWLGHDC